MGNIPLDRCGNELELELIQSHMAQKPMLRGEVGARVRVIRACGQRRENATDLEGPKYVC